MLYCIVLDLYVYLSRLLAGLLSLLQSTITVQAVEISQNFC